MQHPYAVLQSEYQQLLAGMTVTKPVEVASTANRLLDTYHRSHLEPVAKATGVPLILWSALCERESGCRFDRNPAQGDPLTAPSIHVPRGRRATSVSGKQLQVLIPSPGPDFTK